MVLYKMGTGTYTNFRTNLNFGLAGTTEKPNIVEYYDPDTMELLATKTTVNRFESGFIIPLVARPSSGFVVIKVITTAEAPHTQAVRLYPLDNVSQPNYVEGTVKVLDWGKNPYMLGVEISAPLNFPAGSTEGRITGDSLFLEELPDYFPQHFTIAPTLNNLQKLSQDLSGWCVEHIPEAPQNFGNNSPLLTPEKWPKFGEPCE